MMKQQEKCPRCESINTKFCYYNNYNLTQPRHYCKTCRRFWTKGGALRNIPVGGGSRKNSKQLYSTSSSKRPSTMQPPSTDHHQHTHVFDLTANNLNYSQSGMILMEEIQLFQRSSIDLEGNNRLFNMQ